MKKLIAILLAALLLSATAALADGVVYEAEKAEMTGSLKASADAKASGWKVVGTFQGSDDTLTFIVNIPEDGSYDLILTCKGIGGGKTNNVLVDGQQVGQFSCTGVIYEEAALKGVLLTAGEHRVTVTPSWGWIYLDKLEVVSAEAIPDSVYEVEAKLINPNANEDAQELYAYLCESYGKVTLSGQVCDRGVSGPELRAIYELTGKYPAMLGLDMMDYSLARVARGARSTAVEEAIRYHEDGGIITFCWHWGAPAKYILDGRDSNGNPRWWGGFYTENTTFNIADVMSGADPEGKELLDQDIAAIARQLLRLQDAGVPVLWRPLHEASGGWFWWGAQGAEPCKQLWIYLYDELTNKYGCNNLIWVWNGQNAAWYPGDEYVDIIGEDIYAAQHSYGAQTAKFMEVLDYTDATKIIALTENGVVPDIEQIVASNTRWAWFNTWSGDFVQRNGKYSEAYTEAEILKKAYDSEFVITRDELPNFN